ncbi:PREDICTED: lysozyme C-1-like [Nanorana parkeri]|uniref:lysozyme C-1-like n=1 Tax=Nanorana parkeri TaxID=125878 RepID=UPI000854D2D2|nr:PREDICTED: lysozyme C-1-like [Nanorana parkeri]
MKLLLFLAVCLGLCYASEGKVYTNCELYRIFQQTGLAGYRGHSAANWICLAYYESRYNTAAVNNNGPSRDYGIFQINSKWWCNDGKTAGAANACGISCQSLLNDNIYDDIECAKRVVRDPNGISAWVAWRDHCRGKNLSSFTAGC